MAKIEMYTRRVCVYCDHAKHLLRSKNVEFQEIRVDLDANNLQEMLERSSGRRTVPQIFINEVGIGGFDDLAKLSSTGELDQMLKL